MHSMMRRDITDGNCNNNNDLIIVLFPVLSVLRSTFDTDEFRRGQSRPKVAIRSDCFGPKIGTNIIPKTGQRCHLKTILDRKLEPYRLHNSVQSFSPKRAPKAA